MARTERAGPGDEKLTVNVGPVDLGKIDLLVDEGFYATRTDVIRTAIRRLLDEHRRALEDVMTRREAVVGFVRHDAAHFRSAKKRNERLDVRVVGVYQIADDVTPELADEVLDRVSVLGSFRAPPDVTKALGPKVARRKGAA